MNIFKKDNVLNDFMVEKDNEREVLETFGKYHVFAPNLEFENLILKIIGMGINQKENDKVIISEVEQLANVFRICTDVPEEVLEIETFKKIQKNPKYQFKKMCRMINCLIQQEFSAQMSILYETNKMPEPMKKAYIKNAMDAKDKKEDINEHEEYLRLKNKFDNQKDE